jgi:hypothetical protein
MLHQQFSQFLTVDEDDPLLHAMHEFTRLAREVRSCDKYAFGGAFTR